MFYRLRNRTIDNSHFVETDANWLKTYGNVKRSKSIIAGTVRSTFPNFGENRVGEKNLLPEAAKREPAAAERPTNAGFALFLFSIRWPEVVARQKERYRFLSRTYTGRIRINVPTHPSPPFGQSPTHRSPPSCLARPMSRRAA